MARVQFFEKPGCKSNARQKALLRAAGHEVQEQDILSHPWTDRELYALLRARPVPQWFNPEAPRVKSGDVEPRYIDAGSALRLLLADPLLIRRPLLVAGGRCAVGFDEEELDGWIGLRGPEGGRLDLTAEARGCSQRVGDGAQPSCSAR